MDNLRKMYSPLPPHKFTEICDSEDSVSRINISEDISYNQTSIRKPRNSNLELYRIIVMLLIVAHHFVVNSGLLPMLQDSPMTASSAAMLIFGGWGKTGINCFLLITGYFMCQSEMSWQKLLKLYAQIIFYTVIIYVVFCLTGHERLSIQGLVRILLPVKGIQNVNFASCFLLFYLFIPFLNIMVKSLNKREHEYLIGLLLLMYCIFPSIPIIRIDYNYVSWFMALYIIAAYIRIYGLLPNMLHRSWGFLSLLLIVIGSVSVLGLEYIYKSGLTTHFEPYYIISDSHRLLSLAIAVSSFMYFKDLKIPYSKLINAVGGATFGVLLIHANSDAMRLWLWSETVNCVGHFGGSFLWTLGYAFMVVVIIFIVCAGIDWFRGKFIEPHYMRLLVHSICKLKCSLPFKKFSNFKNIS